MDEFDKVEHRHKELYEKIYSSHKTDVKTGMFELESDSTVKLYIKYNYEDSIFVVCSEEDDLLFFTSINQYKSLLKLLRMEAMK